MFGPCPLACQGRRGALRALGCAARLRASWTGYLIGLTAIGIADLAFLFVLVVPGVIELNAGTIAGPVLWFLAVAITPFGLPDQRRDRNGP